MLFRQAVILIVFGIPTVTVAADQDRQVAAEITRLGSKTESAAAVKSLVAIGKPAAPALVTALADPRNDVRALAAEAIRAILAADPSAAPNWHEEAFWKKRIAQVKAGMREKEVLQVLLPDLSVAEREERREMGMAGGGAVTQSYRLDDYWMVCLFYHGVEPSDGIGVLSKAAPEPFREVRGVWIEPPPKFTGVWVTWHVNGQKAHERHYREGRLDGIASAFHDDGSKCFEQHYVAGQCHGTDTGWHPNGRKAYEGQHDHGKQVGTWRHWDENGQVESVKDYGDGKKKPE